MVSVASAVVPLEKGSRLLIVVRRAQVLDQLRHLLINRASSGVRGDVGHRACGQRARRAWVRGEWSRGAHLSTSGPPGRAEVRTSAPLPLARPSRPRGAEVENFCRKGLPYFGFPHNPPFLGGVANEVVSAKALSQCIRPRGFRVWTRSSGWMSAT